MRRGSLQAIPVKLTPNGAGFALKPSGKAGVGVFGTKPNGTMIVVNNSRAQVGKSVRVSISSVRQTSAGRLFFAELAA